MYAASAARASHLVVPPPGTAASGGGSGLKAARKRAGLTQEELSERSGVSLSALRAYERRGKDLSRAQAETVLRLANALKCEIPDILD